MRSILKGLLLAFLPIQVFSQTDPGIEKFNDPNMLVEEAAVCLELIRQTRPATETGTANADAIQKDWRRVSQMANFWSVLHGNSLAEAMLYDGFANLPASRLASCERSLAMFRSHLARLEQQVYARNWTTALQRSRDTEAGVFATDLYFETIPLAKRIGWCTMALATIQDTLAKQPAIMGIDPATPEGARRLAQNSQSAAAQSKFWQQLSDSIQKRSGFTNRDGALFSLGVLSGGHAFSSQITHLYYRLEQTNLAKRIYLETNGSLCYRAAAQLREEQ